MVFRGLDCNTVEQSLDYRILVEADMAVGSIVAAKNKTKIYLETMKERGKEHLNFHFILLLKMLLKVNREYNISSHSSINSNEAISRV